MTTRPLPIMLPRIFRLLPRPQQFGCERHPEPQIPIPRLLVLATS